jgi:hypothetical protein
MNQVQTALYGRHASHKLMGYQRDAGDYEGRHRPMTIGDPRRKPGQSFDVIRHERGNVTDG